MLEINELQLQKNVQFLQNKKPICAIIKSNAYGLGIQKILPILYKSGIKSYGVIFPEEACQIYKMLPDVEICILSYMPLNINQYLEYPFIWTLQSLEEIQRGILLSKEISIYLKIKGSMNRFGFIEQEIGPALKMIKNSKMKLMGIYLHSGFSYPSKEYNQDQCLIHKISQEYHLPIHSISCSFGNLEDSLAKYNRIGISLYKDVICFYGKIVYIRVIRENEYIGYDGFYQSKEIEKIAIVNVGYANGILNNRFKFGFIHGKPYEIVGKICMNVCFLKVDDSIHIGDLVEWIGPHQTLEEISQKNQISRCEVLLSLRENAKGKDC